MSKSLKKNDTALRVLEVLKMLIDGPASGMEIIEKVSLLKGIESIYAKETLLKYFSTMELLGLKIERNKKNDKYLLSKLPIEITLSKEEIKILCLIKEYINHFATNSQKNDFLDMLDNFERSFSSSTKDLYIKASKNLTLFDESEKISEASKIDELQKLCIDAQKLKIGYTNISSQTTEIYTVEPKSVIYENGNAYLYAYNSKLSQNQKLLLQNIVNIVQLPQKVGRVELTNTIVFELKDSLAKSYKLKEGERVLSNLTNRLVVSNSTEDKNMLFKRLLKYGENCKIIQPAKIKQEFKEFVSSILTKLKTEKQK